MLGIEEEQVKAMCEKLLIEFKPDLVFTEKGVSGMCTNCRYEEMWYTNAPLTDLAQHYLHKANITALRRCAQVRQQPDRSFSFLYIVYMLISAKGL